ARNGALSHRGRGPAALRGRGRVRKKGVGCLFRCGSGMKEQTSKKAPDPFFFRQWDAAHVWHPFTQMQEYLATEPLMVVAAEGHYLIDDRGRRLFHGTSGLWCNLFGHRVPEIDAAITEQPGRFAHTTLLGTTHPAVAELAKALVWVAPRVPHTAS